MHRNKYGRQYYALVGGGVDEGETPEQALHRELQEEVSMTIANPRLVIIEDAGEYFGTQYIYLCEYIGGEPKLAADSEEAAAHALGQNLYDPMWLPLKDLPNVEFLPPELRDVILKGLENGFPDTPIELKIPA
ncbi:MAG: mismatch repair protein MutT [Candidatus Saccharibacteria bacterium]|nr:mismatch repair protein MutT [Candidatus Saccharibacteria bacterium]